MSHEATWQAVDDYLVDLLGLDDDELRGALSRSAEAGLPEIQVSPALGAMLGVLTRAVRARHVLEIGTLAGYSTIFLARSVPPGGRVVTLELDHVHADLARTNLERAGLADRVELRVGPALESLETIAGEKHPPFDLVFIDADKPSYALYLEAIVPLCRPGALILADNVVRNGGVASPDSTDAKVLGARRFNEAMARDPRLSGTVIQTVGAKGYDGLALAVVAEPDAM